MEGSIVAHTCSAAAVVDNRGMSNRKGEEGEPEPSETEVEYRDRFDRAWDYSHEAGGTDEPDEN